MFCRNCGVQVAEAAKFCSACGTEAGQTAVTVPKPNRKPWLAIVAGVIVLLIILAMISAGNNSSGASGAGASVAGANVAATPIPAKPSYKVNDTVNVGYWSYRVYRSRWANSIGSDFLRESPDAKFLIVDLGIRNNDKTASTLPPVKLIDAQGREYDETSKAIYLEGSFGPLKNVNPGVTSQGRIAFDVPPGKYSVLVSGGFTSEERATIALE